MRDAKQHGGDWARTTSPSLSALAIAARPPPFDDISTGKPYCALSSSERWSQSRGRHSSLPFPRVRASNGIAPTKAPLSSQKTPPSKRGDRRNSRSKLCVPSETVRRTYHEPNTMCNLFLLNFEPRVRLPSNSHRWKRGSLTKTRIKR